MLDRLPVLKRRFRSDLTRDLDRLAAARIPPHHVILIGRNHDCEGGRVFPPDLAIIEDELRNFGHISHHQIRYDFVDGEQAKTFAGIVGDAPWGRESCNSVTEWLLAADLAVTKL